MDQRADAYVIEMPLTEAPVVDVAAAQASGFSPLPGRFAGVFDPPREVSQGGILLVATGRGYATEGAAAEKLRPDCITVTHVGPSKRLEDGRLFSVDLQPGERVLIAPYAGMRFPRFEHNGWEARDLGVFGDSERGRGDAWHESAIAVWRGGRWVPLHDWTLLKLQAPEKIGIELLDVTKRRMACMAKVIEAGMASSVEYGELVVLAPDTQRYVTRFGEFSPDYVFVKELREEYIEEQAVWTRARQLLAISA